MWGREMTDFWRENHSSSFHCALDNFESGRIKIAHTMSKIERARGKFELGICEFDFKKSKTIMLENVTPLFRLRTRTLTQLPTRYSLIFF